MTTAPLRHPNEKTTTIRRGRLVSIDALRGIAALMVLLHHAPLHGKSDFVLLKALRPVADMGFSGVGLFLVLSGFSIHLRWAVKPDADHRFSIGRFWSRRFWRLYPTYWVALLFSIGCAAIAGGWHGVVHPDTGAAVAAPLPIAIALGFVVVVANVALVPFLNVAWSLALEEHIYAAYSLMLGWIRRVGVVRLVIFSLVLALVWRVAVEYFIQSVPVGQFVNGKEDDLSRIMYRQFPARGFEFALGVLAAELYARRSKLNPCLRSWWVAAALLTASATMFRYQLGAVDLNTHKFYVSDVVLDPMLGFGFFVVVNAMVLCEADLTRGVFAVLRRSCSWVGESAYSLYLIHLGLLALLIPLIPSRGPAQMVGLLAVLILIVAFARVFYVVVEKRFVEKSRNSGSARRAPSNEVQDKPPLVAARSAS